MKDSVAISRQFPGSSRVLVVEDDAVARLILACWFDRWEVSYDMFTSAEAFLPHIDQNPYQCALIDYHLPGRNGLELIRKIREASRRYHYDLPAFYIHSTDSDLRARSLREEVDGFLAKPMPPEALRDTLIRSGCIPSSKVIPMPKPSDKETSAIRRLRRAAH